MATETITSTQASLHHDSEDLSFPTLPPFPSKIPTAPLLRLSLSSLRSSPEESDRLFIASKELGFFYLDLRNDPLGEELLSQSSKFFDLAPRFYDLGRDELSKYDYKSLGSYMGYKGFGSAVVDEKGNLDRNEFYNVCYLCQRDSRPAELTSAPRFLKTTSSASQNSHSHTPISYTKTQI